VSVPRSRRTALLVAGIAAVCVLPTCAATAVGMPAAATPPTTTAPAPAASVRARLPLRPDGYGVARPTPPVADGRFAATVEPVPGAVLARSTWQPDCPVQADDLRYVTVSFRGFDGAAHTGELLLHARVARDVVGVFEELFAAGFPIEQMRVISPAELEAAPAGDDNTTTAFDCRPIVGSTSWSAHASGLAVDLNPFQNPYRCGDLILPELASAYLDRANLRPGMILADGPVVAAFDKIGWTWGGRWRSPVDLHHFSATGY
jgi:hypothetical protein